MAVVGALRSWRRQLDVWIAVALFAVGQSQVWADWSDGGVGTAPHGAKLVRALLVVACVAPLAWRRRAPLLALTVTSAALAVQLLVVVPYAPLLTALLPMAVGNYSAAAYGGRRRAVALLIVFSVEAVIYLRVPEERVAGEVLFAIFVLIGTWVAGDIVRARLNHAEQAVIAAAGALAEQQAAAAQALADERVRIARELHDVIAHSVSLMGVQAGAARTLLDSDVAAARQALRTIETAARSSVAELQRLLAVLRDPEPGPDGRAPQPGLAQLPGLIADVRDAGLPVELSMPETVALPSGVDLAAYRIVQEALTNALKHSGAPTRVDVRCASGALLIEVCDTGVARDVASNAGGHGLVGMRERAALYGGTFQAGPTSRGGFAVRVEVPLRPEYAP